MDEFVFFNVGNASGKTLSNMKIMMMSNTVNIKDLHVYTSILPFAIFACYSQNNNYLILI